ncbi:AAA family ATPase [Halobacterium salinarum]|jgi:cell division control protein 6|uniref:Cdc6/Cdc18 family protein n=1 Tax=Halobacterium salinarum TaxID=2242 RepID=UPI0025533A1C|nr:AAA family ATPase [Halobacterium salinarum]MDL0131938.1 AAA family ATPase [Halobacterium salinarum]MDL0140020.1 AAA family ATPase [Halobacterium salinarum]
MTEYFDDSLVEDVFIKDISYLKPEYQPDEIEERGEEMDEYVNLLAPILKGWDADNIFLFGESGVGKTLATRTLLPELQQKAEDNGVDVDIVETNCSGSQSSYQAAIDIVNELRSPTSPLTTIDLDEPELSRTGYPSSEVYEQLFEGLANGDDYVILVLDEIDGLGSDGELLYQLTRGQSMGQLDSEICIVGISNDLYFKNNMKTSVRDTLCESEVHFPEYDSQDLQSILQRRAEDAFYEDALSEDVIPLCAAVATKEHGSARYAIRILRKATQLAEDEVRNAPESTQPFEQVKERHVREAKRIVEEETVTRGIKNLSDSQRYLLLSISQYHARAETPAGTSDIYATYEATVKEHGKSAISRRGAHNNLLSMVDKGILHISNNARNQRGVPNRYSLVTDLETVASALEESDQTDDGFILDDLRAEAREHGVLDE